MKHRATSSFWKTYWALPPEIREKADHAFERLKVDVRHPSLQLKKVGRYWSTRIDDDFRAVAVER